jgi:tryptophanase
VNADTESLNGKTNRSQQSRSKQGLGGRKNGSEVSYGSYGSRFSHHDVASVMSAVSSSMSTEFLAQQGREISINKAKKSLEHDLKRLEKQLAALDPDNTTTTSSITMSSITGASFSTISARSRATLNRKKRIVVMVPPGKLGVILADR